MNATSDICLSRVVNESILECVNRNVVVKNHWVRMAVNESGSYALIFNPSA